MSQESKYRKFTKEFRMNTNLQPAANRQITICLTQGAHPKTLSSPLAKIFYKSFFFNDLQECPFCRSFPLIALF
jgi:hypothetical protein